MTHSVEVAAVARTLARIFGANENLTESIALAHDIGHTPFGHAGEHELNRLMQNDGGFDHNQQSLRWVDLLDIQYPDFPGLNLTWETRAGLMKHESSKSGAALDGHPVGPRQGLEAQIADIADDITYYAHDADDALLARILTENQLDNQPLWQIADRQTSKKYTNLDRGERIRSNIRNLLDIQIANIVATTQRKLSDHAPQSMQEVMQLPLQLVTFDAEMDAQATMFRNFMYKNVYFSPAISNQAEIATAMLRHLFEYYCHHPESMGKKAQSRLKKDGLKRAVCDYLSGFTDKYVFQEHAHYFR
jgi:dGTPase